jgi:cyclopropane fatty-acyl-phospholipid synthase-like methyltransferase
LTYSDQEFLTRQYRDASKLDARIALHQRFSTNPYGLQAWIFDHLDLPDEAGILDVGCGPGRLWQENHELASHGTININKDTGMFVARK